MSSERKRASENVLRFFLERRRGVSKKMKKSTKERKTQKEKEENIREAPLRSSEHFLGRSTRASICCERRRKNKNLANTSPAFGQHFAGKNITIITTFDRAWFFSELLFQSVAAKKIIITTSLQPRQLCGQLWEWTRKSNLNPPRSRGRSM